MIQIGGFVLGGCRRDSSHGVQKRSAIAKVAKWGIGTGPALHWRTVVDDVRVYGSGHSLAR